MSELIVVGFDDKFKAEDVLLGLLKLEQKNLLALDDAVVVIKNAEGKIRVKSYHDLTEPVPELGNELWGGIISAVVFSRELEIAQGVFDPNFLTKVEASLKPNSSALFVLVRSAEPEAVLVALSGVGGEILRTTLSEAAHIVAMSMELSKGLCYIVLQSKDLFYKWSLINCHKIYHVKNFLEVFPSQSSIFGYNLRIC